MNTTIVQTRIRAMRSVLAFAIIATAPACADKELTPPNGSFSPKLSLQVTVAPPAAPAQQVAPRFLLVAAFYERNSQNDSEVLLAGVNVPLDGTGAAQRVTLPVDLSRCLADDSRRGSKGACSMYVAAALTYKAYNFTDDSGGDPFGESFDYQLIGPIDAGPGRTPVIPPIDLSATRFGVIGLIGDDALRLGGDHTPTSFTGSLAGVPGAGNAAPTLFATTQGLIFPTDPRSNTSPQGPYPQLAVMQNGVWSRVSATTITTGNSQQFTDVTAFAANEAYLAHRAGLFKYDGTSITKVAAVTDSVFSIASSSGAGGKLVIAGGWNGVVWIGNTQTWTRYVLPLNQFLNGGVCITGPNEAFAASTGGGLFRFDGTSWTSVPASNTAGKVNLECPAPGQAFVLAQNNQQLKWNGSTWVSLAPSPISGGRSLNWAVASPSEIYAFGDSSLIDRAFYRFNGSTWQEIGRTRYTQPFVLPWADPRGAFYVGSAFGRVERATSAGVSVISYQPSFRDVTMPSLSNAFVVGTSSFLARWDGAKWTVDAPPAGTQATRELRSVWSDNGKNAWAAGASSTIYRYDGVAWTTISDLQKPVATADNYNSVWGAGTDVWIVGDNSIIHCKAPAACGSESSGGSGALNGVWGTSASNVFAVGAGGRIIRFNGTSWSSMASGTNRALYRIAGSGPNDIWAVGDSVVLRFDGTQWAKGPEAGDLQSLLFRFPNSGSPLPLAPGLWVRSPKEIYLTTDYGAIGRFDGTRWFEPYSTNFGHRFMGISGPPGGCALAITEAQNDNRAPTLFRGIGPSGCLNAPMQAPSSWP